jgi:hypothetical protein
MILISMRQINEKTGRGSGMKGQYLVGIAVVVFLLFAGTSVFELLCPRKYWSVECGPRNMVTGEFLARTHTMAFSPQEIKAFITKQKRGMIFITAQKRGMTCRFRAVRACPIPRFNWQWREVNEKTLVEID